MLAQIILEAREIRAENRQRYEANRAQTNALIQAERDYWNAFMAKAATHAEREQAMDELERLDVLERAS